MPTGVKGERYPMYKLYEVVYREELTDTITRMDIYAPRAAKKVMPGHFVIMRVSEDSERLPLSVCDYDREKGTVTIVFAAVGGTTMQLRAKQQGECLNDFVGPLGKASELEGMKRVAVIGGGMGTSIAYPVARELKEAGCHVDSILGFRNKDFVYFIEQFEKVSDNLKVMTDDGSYGEKGLVTHALKELIEAGGNYDHVVAIGPTPMMKFVSLLTKEHNIATTCAMSPVMVDGTGMCGGCRITVNGERKFVCVDGPEFDGHAIDYDEIIARQAFYGEHERHKRDEHCNLMKMEVAD